MKRIFIAVDISDEARRAAAAFIDELRHEFPRLRVGWERPEKLHLTLKFLGEVDRRVLSEIKPVIGDIAASFNTLWVTLGETGRFPQGGAPRILWVGTESGGGLELLAAQIENRLHALGFERENRRFNPHLTIARLREPRESFELAESHLRRGFEPVLFEVREIAVYESRLLPAGSVYSKLASFPLQTPLTI